jgi:adenine/guanine phosphoribosyltransferase-like PRPP-binding protein
VEALRIYHKAIEHFVRGVFLQPLRRFLDWLRGRRGPEPPPPGSDGGAAMAEPLTPIPWDEVRQRIEADAIARLKDWGPQVVVGSGRTGAICAGVIAINTLPGRRTLPIRVADCTLTDDGMQSDVEALTEKDFKGVERVVVVEGSHRTGQTFRQIRKRIETCNPKAQIKDYALVWAPPSPVWEELTRPELHSYRGEYLARRGLCLPWGTEDPFVPIAPRTHST